MVETLVNVDEFFESFGDEILECFSGIKRVFFAVDYKVLMLG